MLTQPISRRRERTFDPYEQMEQVTEQIELATFEKMLDEVFVVETEGASTQLRLITVTELTKATEKPNIRQEPFSLIFQLVEGNPLEQGTVILRQPANSFEFAMFLVPLGFDEYESVFN